MDEGRAQEFVRDDRLMTALTEINDMLVDIKRPESRGFKYPIIFVVGCPRSGTTLMMQWLASLGIFGYPSNLVARFYANPYFGVRVQQALHTFDNKKQIFPNCSSKEDFTSNNGHTTGALAPSEFWYFWRRFFHFGENQQIVDFHSGRHDLKGFVSELALMELASSMPLVMKGMILSWNLPELYSLFEKCLIINVNRLPADNAESLYFSRKTFFGDTKKWYSFKPPEYLQLKKLSPLEQVAGQVYFNRQAIENGLGAIPEDSVLHVSHEAFCTNPVVVYDQIKEKLGNFGLELPDYSGAKNFNKNTGSRLSIEERETIDAFLSRLDDKKKRSGL